MSAFFGSMAGVLLTMGLLKTVPLLAFYVYCRHCGSFKGQKKPERPLPGWLERECRKCGTTRGRLLDQD